jgi:hypothetical protein
MLWLLLPLLLPMLLPLLPPEANVAAVAAATADNSAHYSRSCDCLLMPLLMPAADKAVCCYLAAACLRLRTNAATTTDAPHQMLLRQILLPLTLQELIPCHVAKIVGKTAAAKIYSNICFL